MYSIDESIRDVPADQIGFAFLMAMEHLGLCSPLEPVEDMEGYEHRDHGAKNPVDRFAMPVLRFIYLRQILQAAYSS